MSFFREDDDERTDPALRPERLVDYTGQRELTRRMNVFIQSARKRAETLDHVLLWGPPGLGKTTMAAIVANELGVGFHATSGPAVDKKGDLAALLTDLQPGDVLFIDEIHRLSPVIEENLYPAMEDFQLDIFLGEGPHARSIKLDLPRFTLIGATTRTGLLTSPLLARFGITERLDFYEPADLTSIVSRSASILGIIIDDDAAFEIARRSRGTPRTANRLLRRVRDFMEVEGMDLIDLALAEHAMEQLGIDNSGFDKMDRRYIETLVLRFGGGPTGLNTLAAALGESAHTLEDVYEPYLLREGLIQRTPRGRVATTRAFEICHVEAPEIPPR